MELIQHSLEQLELYSTVTNLVEDIIITYGEAAEKGRMPKFGAKFEVIFPFSSCHFLASICVITPPVCCQNFDLVGNKLKSCPRYCENIVFTEEKTATPKKQIRLKMSGGQMAKGTKFWFSEEVQML